MSRGGSGSGTPRKQPEAESSSAGRDQHFQGSDNKAIHSFFLNHTILSSPLSSAQVMASDDPQRASIHAALQEPPHDVQLPPAPSPPSQAPHVRFGGADGQSQVQDDLAALKDVKAKLSSYTTLWSAKARETTVVRGRQGSVLTRGLVLKTDQFQGTRGE